MPLLGKINNLIVNPLIILGFVVATIILFWGIVKFISKADDDTARNEGRRSIIYGVIGLVIMFSVYGIINFVLSTFDITPPQEARLQ